MRGSARAGISGVGEGAQEGEVRGSMGALEEVVLRKEKVVRGGRRGLDSVDRGVEEMICRC